MTHLQTSECFCVANKRYQVCTGGWTIQEYFLIYVSNARVFYRVSRIYNHVVPVFRNNISALGAAEKLLFARY
jgi:hypothetical protein